MVLSSMQLQKVSVTLWFRRLQCLVLRSVLSDFTSLRSAECVCSYYGLRVCSQTNKINYSNFGLATSKAPPSGSAWVTQAWIFASKVEDVMGGVSRQRLEFGWRSIGITVGFSATKKNRSDCFWASALCAHYVLYWPRKGFASGNKQLSPLVTVG